MRFAIFIRKNTNNTCKLEKIARIGSHNQRMSWFLFENDNQHQFQHQEIFNLDVVKNRIMNMKRDYATLTVTLPDDLIAKYLDKEENFFFNLKYLEEENEEEEFNNSVLSQDNQTEEEELRKKLDEATKCEQDKRIELAMLKIRELELQIQLRDSNENDKKIIEKELNLEKIEKKINLFKFNGSQEAKEFIIRFERELDKYQVKKDEDKIILFKAFLDDKILNWYYANDSRTDRVFELWKEKFLMVYGSKGWLSSKKAIEHKYMGGKFSDYGTKKYRLLIEDDKLISESMLIKLIVIGLPIRIYEKIDREETNTVEKLFKILVKLDSEFVKPIDKKFDNNGKKKSIDNKKVSTSFTNKTSLKCSYCNRTNHSDDNCWFKSKINKKEANLSEENDKNESNLVDKEESELFNINLNDSSDSSS